MSTPPYRVLITNWKDRSSIVFLPQILFEAGCEVHVLAPVSNLLARAQGVARVYDAPTEFQDYKTALFQHINNATPRYDWVIPAEDSLLYKLAGARAAEPWINDLLPTPKIDAILSKANFLILTRQLGLPAPQSGIYHNRAEIEDHLEQLTFPLVIKNNLGYNGFGTGHLASKAELREHLDTYANLIYPLILQAYIEGEPASTLALFDRGRLISWFSCWTPHTHIERIQDFTQPREIQLHDFPQVESYLRKLGEATGFHGFSGVDFVVDAHHQKIHLLEMHARPVAGYQAGKLAGVDFSKALRAMLDGEGALFQDRQDPTKTDSISISQGLHMLLKPENSLSRV